MSHMFRKFSVLRNAMPMVGFMSAGLIALALAAPAQEQQRRARIDVKDIAIDAEISPNLQTITSKATVNFVAMDDGISSAIFELNNALNLTKVEDASGKPIDFNRNQQDFSVRLNLQPPLAKGQAFTANFYYDGKLTGNEESPVFGIKFAAIHPDFAYLMYPARWFPVAGYTTDRFAADTRVTVPMGYTVLGSGIDSKQTVADKNVFEFKLARHSFPGSIAVVKDQPVRAQSEGVTTALYFRGANAEMAQPYGQEIGKVMSYFTGTYGLPPYANLTVVETEAGAPNGYAAPGMIFLAPAGITRQVASKLLANEVSRQWWEELVSPATRNHLWLTNGLASYSELLWTEQANGAPAAQSALR